MTTEQLNVLDSAGRVLGTVEVDIFRLDKLLHFAGSCGWKAYEALSPKERAEFGLKAEDAVRLGLR